MNCNEKVPGYSTCNDSNKIALNIVVLTSSNMFQVWDAFQKVMESCMWLKNQEVEIKFNAPNLLDAPFSIMVPEPFMPMVKQLWC